MLYSIDMDIFSAVLSSRPSTFTTFGASGAVENGLAPASTSGSTTAAIGFLNAGFTHGATATVTYPNGRFVQPGLSGSFEMVIKPSAAPTSSIDTVMAFGGSGELNVGRKSATFGTGTEYVLTATSPSGTVTASLYTSLIPSADYVALTVTPEVFTLYVNGSTVSLARPLDMPALSSFSARGASNKLVYYVAIRENPMPETYHDQIYAHLGDTFAPLSVDGLYLATTFIFDVLSVDLHSSFELLDVPQPVYTAEPSDSFNVMPTPGEDGSFDVTLGTTNFKGIDLPVLGTYTEETAPDEASTLTPGSTLNLLGPDAMIISSNMPDRTGKINPGSYLSWDSVIPSMFGSAVIDSDSQATTTAEYPTAYSMWVYLSTTSPGSILSGGAISLSVSGGAITRAGMSQIYVDGVAGATTITAGWHNISFIPTTAQNAALNIGEASVAVASFSLLYAASPSSYLVAMYNAYNNPPKVTGSETGTIIITEQTPSVYDNKWSIKSVD